MQQRDATAIGGGIIVQEPIMPYAGITKSTNENHLKRSKQLLRAVGVMQTGL